MRAYSSGLGQVDNTGDTLLRRMFLAALRRAHPLTVFVGDRGSEYTSALGLTADDRVVTDTAEWRRELVRAMGKGQALYAFNSGELEVNRAYARYYGRISPLVLANRLRGGHALHVGFGLRPPVGAWRYAMSPVLRACDIVTWRDSWSHSQMPVGSVAPDWAFFGGTEVGELWPGTTARRYLSVAFRYNHRLPEESWLMALGSAARRFGLQVRVLAQIERDQGLAAAVAARLGGEAVWWTNGNLREQEARLRDVYRDSAFVVSNRLHGLIMGYTEGALPIAYETAPQGKALRTLAAVIRESPSVDGSESESQLLELLFAIDARREDLLGALNQARWELSSLRDRIARLS